MTVLNDFVNDRNLCSNFSTSTLKLMWWEYSFQNRINHFIIYTKECWTNFILYWFKSTKIPFFTLKIQIFIKIIKYLKKYFFVIIWKQKILSKNKWIILTKLGWLGVRYLLKGGSICFFKKSYFSLFSI